MANVTAVAAVAAAAAGWLYDVHLQSTSKHLNRGCMPRTGKISANNGKTGIETHPSSLTSTVVMDEQVMGKTLRVRPAKSRFQSQEKWTEVGMYMKSILCTE